MGFLDSLLRQCATRFSFTVRASPLGTPPCLLIFPNEFTYPPPRSLIGGPGVGRAMPPTPPASTKLVVLSQIPTTRQPPVSQSVTRGPSPSVRIVPILFDRSYLHVRRPPLNRHSRGALIKTVRPAKQLYRHLLGCVNRTPTRTLRSSTPPPRLYAYAQTRRAVHILTCPRYAPDAAYSRREPKNDQCEHHGRHTAKGHAPPFLGGGRFGSSRFTTYHTSRSRRCRCSRCRR